MLNKKAFTLAELLIALAVIGAIAALTVPSLFSNINNKLLLSQLKGTVATIQQLASDQMVMHRTKYLENTDFSDPVKLLSSNNFSITQTCDSDSAESDCWRFSWNSDSSEFVNTYKTVGKVKIEKQQNGSKKVKNSLSAFNNLNKAPTVKLKNGVMLTYYNVSDEKDYNNGDKVIGYFFFDVNGNDKPNIIGRDLFGFYITNKGVVMGPSDLTSVRTPKKGEEEAEYDPMIHSANKKVEKCKSGAEGSEGWCFDVIMSNGWEMPY